MKKILMSLAIAGAMLALASCSCCNNCKKAAEEPAAVEACTECDDKECCEQKCDAVKCAECCDKKAECCDKKAECCEKKAECCEKKAECEKKCCNGCDSTAVKECCKTE